MDEVAPQRKILEPDEGAIESPLFELAFGVGFVLLATLVAWIAVTLTADAPLVAASQEAGAPTCGASCTAGPTTTLPQEWQWEPEAYRFDEIYSQSEPPAAYSFDFVYPRPFALP